MNKFKSIVKSLASEGFIFLHGIIGSLLGFANVVAFLFGLNCFINIKIAESWAAIGYFFGALAMVVIFVFCSYIFGVAIKKIFKKK